MISNKARDYILEKEGVVIRSTGSWYQVKDTQGDVLDCKMKGKFRLKGSDSTNPIAVGDRVSFELEGDVGVITRIEDRKNHIVRKSVNLSKKTHVLAANIDQAFLVVTVAYPYTSLGFIDRFLISAEAYRIPVVLLFNKCDVYKEEEYEKLKEYQEIYEGIGYQTRAISAFNDADVETIRSLMQDKVSIFSGHSGVGKSTLINALDENLGLLTQEISDAHQQGQHTTTFAEMHEIEGGGYVIDTPGVKGFGLAEMEKEEIRDYFPEMRNLAQECKFHNCLHVNEPKCAVRQAVEAGEIAPSRYANYLGFIEGDDEPYRTNKYSI